MSDQTISHYRILEKLGAGGMGVVYKAEDTRLGRLVAIKFLPEGSLRDPQALERFQREARTASALDHPNICTIYEIDEEAGRPFIVMQLLEGQTLRERIGNQPVPLPTLLDWGAQIADGLQAAHASGIVHRDIKPPNIFITTRGQVKVLDFGLAKLTLPGPVSTSDATRSVQGHLTNTGAPMGTVAYMSPEQARGELLDARTDLFSFGIILYEMATGKQAFPGNTWAVVVHAILGQSPIALHEAVPGLPLRLQQIIDKALVKDREQRYSSAAEMQRDLLGLKQDVESGKDLKKVRGVSAVFSRLKSKPAIVAGIVLIAAAVWGWRTMHPGSLLSHGGKNVATSSASSQSTTPQAKIIAVLPFAPIENDAKLTLLGRGLLEGVAAKLSQLSANHELEIVPARSLADKKIASLDDARKEFGVNLGLTISLEQSDDIVRAAYNLIDAKTGKNLSGNSITAPASDLFSLEDQIARDVASALQITLRSEDKRNLAAHSTSQPQAFEYFIQGRGYLEEGFKPESLTSAEILFKQALKVDPNYGQAQAALGETYWHRYEETKSKQWIAPAQQACARAVALGNAGVEGHMCLGLLANGTGQYQQAVQQFQQAVQLEPGNDEASVNLADAYQSLNQLDKAEDTYKRAIAMRPDYWRGYNRLGAFYAGQADYPRAHAMFVRAVELAPDSYRAYSNLGGTMLSEGKNDEALQALHRSLAIYPTYEAHKNIAYVQFQLQHYHDAVESYREALKLDSGDYQTWGDMGEAYYYGGDTASGLDSYRKAISLGEQQLKINPRDAALLADLASYNSMLGNREQALQYLDRSLQLGQTDKQLLFNAALVYNQLHETGVALEWLSKALAAGYSRSLIAKAPALNNLHQNPQYQALLHE